MDALKERVLRWIVRLTDVLVIVLSMALSRSIHGQLIGVVPGFQAQTFTSYFFILCAVSVPFWWAALIVTGADRILYELPPASKVGVDLIKVHAVALGGALSLLWFAQVHLNRGVLVLFVGVNFLTSLLLRLLLVRWGHTRLRHGSGRRWLVMVGDAEGLKEAESAFTSAAFGLHPLPAETDEQALEGLRKSLHELPVDHVVFLPPFDSLRRLTPLLEVCEDQGIPAMIPHFSHPEAGRLVEFVRLFGVLGVSVSHRLKPSVALATKQLIDILGTAIGLVVIAPLLLVVSALILFQDGRPVFFSQDRVGLNGRRFRMHKFRTMVKDAEARKAALQAHNEAGGPVFKMSGDPRITPFGNFLRRTSIDELPQLFNVLMGDMSLVGPRPLPVPEQQQIHGEQRRRLAMKPGITGLWQVSGRSNITFEQWMKLDLKYVDEWSLWLDIRILMKTVPTVLFGKGAR